ncbi:MAG: hypothetical protein GX445_08925 [Elusimicrobia bacterium]|nr:hypothetical protein [Elusimicrobiota bacterium]
MKGGENIKKVLIISAVSFIIMVSGCKQDETHPLRTENGKLNPELANFKKDLSPQKSTENKQSENLIESVDRSKILNLVQNTISIDSEKRTIRQFFLDLEHAVQEVYSEYQEKSNLGDESAAAVLTLIQRHIISEKWEIKPLPDGCWEVEYLKVTMNDMGEQLRLSYIWKVDYKKKKILPLTVESLICISVQDARYWIENNEEVKSAPMNFKFSHPPWSWYKLKPVDNKWQIISQ